MTSDLRGIVAAVTEWRRRRRGPPGRALQPRHGRPAGDEGTQHHRHHAAARRLPGRAAGCASWSCARRPPRTARRSATRPSSPSPPRRRWCRAAGSPRTSSTSRGTSAGFRRRRPDVTTTVLRLAPVRRPARGHHADPLLRPAGGADRVRPRPAAAVHPRRRRAGGAACARSWRTTPAPTTWPGAGVMVLSQAIRRAGRVGVPVLEPGMSAFAAFVKASGLRRLQPRPARPFVHGRVVDTTPADRGVRLPAAQHRGGVRRLRRRAEACTAPERSRRCGRTRSSAVEALVLDGIRAVRSAATVGRGARSRPVTGQPGASEPERSAESTKPPRRRDAAPGPTRRSANGRRAQVAQLNGGQAPTAAAIRPVRHRAHRPVPPRATAGVTAAAATAAPPGRARPVANGRAARQGHFAQAASPATAGQR